MNQLFKKEPTDEIILKLIQCLGLKDLNDKTEFSKLQMEHINTIIRFKLIEEELKKFYLPCKAKKYLNKYEYKNIITICRQFLKIKNYTLVAKEKYIKTKKYLNYKLITLEEKKITSTINKNETYVLNFD